MSGGAPARVLPLPAPPPPGRPLLRIVPPPPDDDEDFDPWEEEAPTEVMDRLPWEEIAEDPPPAPVPADMELPPRLHPLRRMWSGPALMHHNRLILLALAVNGAVLATWDGLRAAAPAAVLGALSDLALANFAVAILIRQQYVINLLFWLATRAPVGFPLAIRSQLAKVYHFGGIHVGCALAGTAWFAALAGHIVIHRGALAISGASTAVALAQLPVLLAITVMSLPRVRARHHDAFELVKRFGGWTSLALLSAQTVLLTADRGADLASAPQTWVVAAMLVSVALPWLRLRRVPVDLVIPSSHVALARFDYGVTPFAGSSTAISRSPLREWHSFANVPSPGQTGFRLTISRAGDWTGKLIDDRPSHLWVKGIPTAGVANIEVLFKKVLYVATGSGIGPCLPHLLARKVPARLLWATRDARATYGDPLVDEILAVHPDALIWDTHARGKPDMVKLAYQMLVESGAEAVICISNKKLTWQVVSGMESRGIPAYGAIWDS